MKTYKEYLEEQNYSDTTIENYTSQIKKFIVWCRRNHTSPEAVDYKTCMKYLKYLQRRPARGGGNINKKTVNHKLGILKNYLNYLVAVALRLDNPIETTTIKGIKRTVHYNLLESDELEDLYYSYESDNVVDKYHKLCAKRNRVIVGLMVYQGLNTSELIRLELEDLQLYKGKVYIKSGTKSNSRTLELKPWQVIESLEYIKEVREEIIHRKKLVTDRVFVPGNKRLDNTIYHIVKKLKKVNHKVGNIHQIRASVITNWLKRYNLRQVQVMAGHRYISSTEKYLQDDLESLHEIVNNFHPIS